MLGRTPFVGFLYRPTPVRSYCIVLPGFPHVYLYAFLFFYKRLVGLRSNPARVVESNTTPAFRDTHVCSRIAHPAPPRSVSKHTSCTQGEALRKVNLDISDIDSDTGRRKKTDARPRRKKKSASGASSAGGEKRRRKSRGSSNGDNSSGDRKKRRKVAAASAAANVGPASSPGRRLVKPHRKKAKKLVAGGGETASNAVMLLEDTSSSGSEGGGGKGALRRSKGKNKREAEKPRTNKAHSGPRKKKQGSESEGSGTGNDLLGALIGNAAPARKKTSPSAAVQAQGNRPKPVRQRSADSFERRGSGDGATAAPIGSRGPPVLARGGSLNSATSSVSLAQYRGGLRNDVPGGVPNLLSRKPGKSAVGPRIAKAGLNGGVGKKTGAEHARPDSKTPAHKSSASSSSSNRGASKRAPATSLPAPSNNSKDKYERVPLYTGVYRKKSNGKYFVWTDGAPLDGTPYDT